MYKNIFKYDEMKRSEHMAVRTAVGWYFWTHQLLEITGPDVTAFLEYMTGESRATDSFADLFNSFKKAGLVLSLRSYIGEARIGTAMCFNLPCYSSDAPAPRRSDRKITDELCWDDS